MGIAQSIIDVAVEEAAARGAAAVRTVGLELGELAGVDANSLEFCFDCLKSGTPLAAAALAIEVRRRRERCAACGHEYEIAGYDLKCPVCGGADSTCVSGQELSISYLEVESDDEPEGGGEDRSQSPE